MDAWTQLIIDWEKADRDAESLREHLRLCGFEEADRSLLGMIAREGQWVREGSVARSVLRVSMRKAAEMAGISRSAVHKAKDRLSCCASPVMRYETQQRQSVFVVSWSRVWGREPLRPPDFAEPAVGSLSTAVHGCPRPYQESKRDLSPPIPNPRNQEPKKLGTSRAEPAAIGELLGGGATEAMVDLHAACLLRSARNLYARVRRVEDRLGVEPRQRITPSTAKRIALGVSEDPDSDVAEEVERILGSLENKTADTLRASPAAYVVGCAKRRRWIGEAAGGNGACSRREAAVGAQSANQPITEVGS